MWAWIRKKLNVGNKNSRSDSIKVKRTKHKRVSFSGRHMFEEFDVSLLNCLPSPKFATSFDMSVVKISYSRVTLTALKVNTTTNASYFHVLGEEVRPVQVVSRLWLAKKFRYSLLIGRSFWFRLETSNLGTARNGFIQLGHYLSWVINYYHLSW